MSRSELWNGNRLRSADFTLALGILAQVVPNFYLNVSKIVSLEMVTPIGVGAGSAVVANIAIQNNAAIGPHAATVTVASTVNTDLSVYRLWWVNEFASNSAASYVQ